MSYRRRVVKTDIEEKMLIGLIVSDRVCRELIPIIDIDCLQVDYIREIIGWIKDYYTIYEKAPGKHIRDIFDQEIDSMEEARSSLLNDFLIKLSNSYAELSEFNEEYLIDKSIRYLDEREMWNLSSELRLLLDSGDIGSAKSKLNNFKKVVKKTSSWVNPFDQNEVNKSMDVDSYSMFRFPGRLGDLAGDFERGFFVAFLGPAKRGKTWLLIELSLMAVMYKYKVVFISLEMSKERMERRLYQRISSTNKKSTSVVYPIMDCWNNQDGSCEKEERENSITLLDDDGDVPAFDGKSEYRACTYCRKNSPADFIPAQWYIEEKRPSFNLSNMRKTIKAFYKTFGDRFRLKSYPRFSANLRDVMNDLDALEYSEGFVPDVIILDYADILAHEKERESVREMIDDTWKTLARISDEKNKPLVITVSQSNKKSWDAKSVKAGDVSEDYRKIAHVDMMFSLNQTPEEKKEKIMRLGIVAHRDKDFSQFNHVRVLQQLDAGQPLLDSEYDNNFSRDEDDE